VKPRGADQGVVFPGVQKSTWSYDAEAKAWYFHRFYDFQPDLNTSNPAVQSEILKIMGFWVQQGVSGFRMDAVPFVISTKGPQVTRPKEQYDMLRRFREFLQWRQGDLIVLAEANVLPDTDLNYFGEEGERMQMMFNFQVNQNLFYALAAADSGPLVKAMQATKPRPATAQWGQFLRNHDELDLGRLSEQQRQKVFAGFAPNPEMQLYDRGIRRRLAPMLKGDRRRIEMAYSLMFTLPGTPVLRYGDEIGMGDDLSLPERNCARTPMQWSNEPHGGFTKSDRPILPVISGGPYGYEHVNAAIQAPSSGLAAELDRADHSHAQGSARDRLGRLHGPPGRRSGRAGDALRLAQQFGTVRAQSRRRATGDRVLGRPQRRKRAARAGAGQPAVGGSQPGRGGRPAPVGDRALRLSLVPGRRARLSLAPQRDRRARGGARSDCALFTQTALCRS
jgi:hypothetical protein